MIDKIRDDVLGYRGCIVHRMSECRWRRLRRTVPRYQQAVETREEYESQMVLWSDNKSMVPWDYVLQQIVNGKVDGIAFVDIHTPDRLKERYKYFAPIIKHATVTMKDIGPYMQDVAKKLNIKMGPKGRRNVIDSYFGVDVGLTCESIRQLITMGLEVTNIRRLVRYRVRCCCC